MARHLIHIILSVPYRSRRRSSLVNACVISKWCYGTSAIMAVMIVFIGCSVHLLADIAVSKKARLEYSRSGAVKYRVLQQHYGIKNISTSYNAVKHTDHCCRVFTQRLENLNVGDTYSEPTAYHLYTTHRLSWCNAPPTANLYS